MSRDEAAVWARYRSRYGSLSVGRKVDEGAALQAFMSGKVVGKNAKISDFLPQQKQKKKAKTDDEFLTMFKAMAAQQNDFSR